MSSFRVLYVLGVNIALTVLAQTLLRAGMRHVTKTGSWTATVWRVGTNPLVFGGLATFVVSVVLWLYLLSKLRISTLYPIQQSLVFILLQLVAWRWLGEGISATKLLGILVICVGVVLVARG